MATSKLLSEQQIREILTKKPVFNHSVAKYVLDEECEKILRVHFSRSTEIYARGANYALFEIMCFFNEFQSVSIDIKKQIFQMSQDAIQSAMLENAKKAFGANDDLATNMYFALEHGEQIEELAVLNNNEGTRGKP